jgi:poly-gamma-glutamate capsule biosynthesis protein CapA/YwtB (metallophosphatase superfamily)
MRRTRETRGGRRCAVAVSVALIAVVIGACGEAHRGDTTPKGGATAGKRSAEGSPPRAQRRVRAPQPEPVRHLTIEVNGDLLIHSPIFDAARALAGGRGYDFAPMLRRVRPLIRRADLAFCHVETPMAPGPPSGYPRFRTPPALARAIRTTGWDACDTASNHSLDFGQAGIDATGRALRRAGVRHTGSFSSPRGRRRLLIMRRRGVKVAFLAYTAITNGLPLPHRWSLNLADPRRILRDARRARRAGAQVVLVNVHWGTEYRSSPDAYQRALARRLARSRLITAVVGQHVHVVQPIRRIAGRWVVFGEGNLLSNQTAACCPTASQDGMLVFLHVRVQGARAVVKRIDYVPTWVRHPDFTVLPVGRALGRRQADPALLRASWKRTAQVVGRTKRLRPVPRRLR